MARVTLTDRETRERMMRDHVRDVAQSIVDDDRGDAVFAELLSLRRHVRRYSIRNMMLILWQAPDSRLVASRTAFSKMAEEQGHRPKTRTSKKGKSWDEYVFVAGGSKAVWIWGQPRVIAKRVTVVDPDTGVEIEEEDRFTRFFACDVYQAEDVRYADTGEPLEMPSFVDAVDDVDLFEALHAFAASRDIAVEQTGLHGAGGASSVGHIDLQKGDHWTVQVATLVHELGHELLHDLDDRLNGDRRLHEAEAESVAAVVLRHFGHDMPLSPAYLRNHGIRPADVIRSMDRIARAATEIVEFVEAYAASSQVEASPSPSASVGHPVSTPATAAFAM
jgi:hypothetical protein